jgi:hypothetical protein
MTTDYRALCVELADALAEWQLGGGPPEDIADADLINRARAALAQPEPVAPTDEEIMAFWSEHCAGDGDAGILRLARWGTPAIQPVPVSERLPGAEDCDAEGRCWWHRYTPTKEWHLQRLRTGQYNHWLPHWALPAPANNTRGTH